MRSISDDITEPVYIDMFAERASLREDLANLRSQLATAAGPQQRDLESRIAKIEKKISDLTNKLPSSMR